MEYMKNTTALLAKFKKESNFKSLREFHTYLSNRGFSANYQHFAKIYSGDTVITSETIKQFSNALPEISDEITLAYCQDIFPQKNYLFQSQKKQKVENKNIGKEKKTPSIPGASLLSEKQISILSKTKENYFIFLICTMARNPISATEIESIIIKKIATKSIQVLLDEGIIIETNRGLQTFNTEISFPVRDKYNEQIYGTFDQWDLEFANEMKMEKIIKRTMLRRISPRYFSLIQNHINLLIESLRISDESDTKHNTEVVQLNIQIHKGQLPG